MDSEEAEILDKAKDAARICAIFLRCIWITWLVFVGAISVTFFINDQFDYAWEFYVIPAVAALVVTLIVIFLEILAQSVESGRRWSVNATRITFYLHFPVAFIFALPGLIFLQELRAGTGMGPNNRRKRITALVVCVAVFVLTLGVGNYWAIDQLTKAQDDLEVMALRKMEVCIRLHILHFEKNPETVEQLEEFGLLMISSPREFDQFLKAKIYQGDELEYYRILFDCVDRWAEVKPGLFEEAKALRQLYAESGTGFEAQHKVFDQPFKFPPKGVIDKWKAQGIEEVQLNEWLKARAEFVMHREQVELNKKNMEDGKLPEDASLFSQMMWENFLIEFEEKEAAEQDALQRLLKQISN